jgi:hypothetical protein
VDARLGSNHRCTHGWLPLAVPAALVVVFSLTLQASPAAGASPTSCRVENADTGSSYTTLQSAVDAAEPGVRLIVRGTCVGTTVIDKRLAIKGVWTDGSGRPILDGDGKDHVFRIKPAGRVTIRGLVVQGGRADRVNKQRVYHPGRGAGILNRGTLGLWSVVVRRNAAWEGAGVYNAGVLRPRGASRVTENVAYPYTTIWTRGTPHLGVAGLYNTGIASLNDGSSIRDNTGSGVSNSGTLTLNDRSSISRNGSSYPYNGSGGVVNKGTMTMNGSSVISDNRSGQWGGYPVAGGGVSVSGGATLILNDASAIRGNLAAGGGVYFPAYGDFTFGGGGVWLTRGGSATLNDASSIAANRAQIGGGVYMWSPYGDDEGTLTMTGSSRITGNTGRRGGGGVAFEPRSDTLVGVGCGPEGNVYGNTPDDCYFE